MKNLHFSWKYALAIALIAVMGYMVMGFNNRMADLRGLAAQFELAKARLESVMAEKAALQTQIAEATMDATVIEWAYSEGHLKKPGDMPVVPLAPGNSTPTPVATPVSPQLPVENWQIWMLLFVDQIEP